MQRRVLMKAFLLSLVCGPAFAADPLPPLPETPMFVERVKSGALPPVAERIPRPPRIVREFAGSRGLRRIVTDANATTFNSVVAGGGANTVPVFSDNAVWRIG